MNYYVYHVETFLSGTQIKVFEPFEFNSKSKATEHANFFHALCNLDYKVISSHQLQEL